MRLLIIPMLAVLAACGSEPAEPPEGGDAVMANAAALPPAVIPPAPVPSAEPAGEARLTAEGWGPLRIGMTRAEVEAALGPDSDPEAVGGPDPERCDQFRPARAPEGMLVMIGEGRLTRISLIRDAEVPTDRGLRIGDAAAAVRVAYGEAIRSAPHEYLVPKGGYLTVWTKGGGDGEARDSSARGILYEIGADDRIQSIHAGGPAIRHVEGCV